MNKNKKTALVAGGAGFVGSHLCDLLINQEIKVICLDNLLTGSKENIKHLLNNENFTFLRHDIAGPLKLDEPINYIYNLASPASPVDYLNHPIKTLATGSLGSFNLLALAKTKKAKYLLASTSEVYGDPQVSPQKEDYWGNVNPIGPRSVYDEAKRFAEATTMAYWHKETVNTAIARIFNTYGPRMKANDGRVIPNFITQALKNEPLTVYGNGQQTRSFCFVSDLIQGLYQLMQSDIHTPVNLGNPIEKTVLEVAKYIIKLVGSKSSITNKPLPVDDPKIRQPDISRANEVLAWQPKVDLEAGLRETINWFRGSAK